MSFFAILKECNLDWDKARRIFCNLTDLQIVWLNEAFKIEESKIEDEVNKRKDTGSGTRRSFDMRR